MGDLHEIFVWEDGVKLMETRCTTSKPFTRVDVIPSVDAIRALMGTEDDWRASAKTDAAISAYNGL